MRVAAAAGLLADSVRSLDRTVLARVHVALHYKDPTDEDRERIWLNNFDRLARESTGNVYVSAAAQAFVWANSDVRALQWTGREIRNAVQTALILAEHDADEDGSATVIIHDKHLKAVVDMKKGVGKSTRKGLQQRTRLRANRRIQEEASKRRATGRKG